jgi:hypothetical protein
MSENGKTVTLLSAFVLATLFAAGTGRAQPANSGNAPAPTLVYAEQGWLDADRDAFYTTSQGSSMMPYVWFRALQRLDANESFGGDKLQRYGYLPNERPKKNFEDLPVGFVVNGDLRTGDLGMTCAACHTGQIEYQKDGATKLLRVDGAPANADFQQFLTDLVAAARATLMDNTRFDAFARAVLGPSFSTGKANSLRTDFKAWVTEFGDFMDKSLPPSPWGPGRLDAFGMIFNRVTALDLGKRENFRAADAPVSYPFLWNASRQDRTQWNGAVPNGLYIHALGRNTGEVFGVFARFKPDRRFFSPVVSYLKTNSVEFGGLQTLEEKIVKLKPPPWPSDFPFDPMLARQGAGLFNMHCKSCHSDGQTEEEKSKEVPGAWRTLVKAVGTDPKLVENAKRMVDPGILRGQPAALPPVTRLLGNPATAQDVLGVAVVGTLAQRALKDGAAPSQFQQSAFGRALKDDMDRFSSGPKFNPARVDQALKFLKANLDFLFTRPPTDNEGAAYESRALHGIWATAPYLHNGSVPNLWELLKPAKDRKMSFLAGNRVYDPENVGFMTDKSPFKNAAFTVDPANANGNGNGGHEYGSNLSENERRAIVEFLKTY